MGGGDFAGAKSGTHTAAKNRPFRVCVHTLGCRVNQSESAMYADYFKGAGFEVVEDGTPADLMLVNSCALTEFAEAKTRRAIKFFRKRNPSARVYVTGCYAQTNPSELLKIGVDGVVSNAQKRSAAQAAADDFMAALSGKARQAAAVSGETSFEAEREKLKNPDLSDLGFFGVSKISDRVSLKIQDGCDNACAYCIIPRARGLPRSRGVDEILSDAKNLAMRGAREITLTGINMAKFSGSLADLIERISEIPEILRIGMGSLEPPLAEVERLCALMNAEGSKLAKHFHVSLQSACDKTLKNMRRKYSVEEFFGMVDFIKGKNPRISVGTDVICGFPEETHGDFLECRNRIEKSALSFLHVFTFSARKGTLAASRPQIPLAERRARSDDLRLLGARIGAKFYETLVGSEDFALLENRLNTGEYMARLSNFVQVRVRNLPLGMKNEMVKVRVLPAKNGVFCAEPV